MSKERLGHGQARHRRKTIADERKEIDPDIVGKTITEWQRAEQKLQEINKILVKQDEEKSLTPKQTAVLEIEEIWLRFKIGKIDRSKRQSGLDGLLNRLEKETPDVYTWLTTTGGKNGETPLVEIRNRVLPPKNNRSYYTRR